MTRQSRLLSMHKGKGREGKGREGEREGRVTAPTRFNIFWEAYPNKKGIDDARKAFDKRKPDDELLTTMLQALGAQSQSPQWVKDKGQFIPNPSTWLNQGRWQDQAVAPAKDTLDDWVPPEMRRIEKTIDAEVMV